MHTYEGRSAIGSENTGFEAFLQATTLSDACEVAYAMEQCLQEIYLKASRENAFEEISDLLEKLADLERGHMARIRKLCGSSAGDAGPAGSPADTGGRKVEGGFSEEQVSAAISDTAGDRTRLFEIAMMLEAQALDLYTRLARKSEDQQLQELYTTLAEDERKHLAMLEKRLELDEAGHDAT